MSSAKVSSFLRKSLGRNFAQAFSKGLVGKNQTRFYPLLISLCIHLAAFIFMGAAVLHVVPEARESVSVELVGKIQQEPELRRSIPEPRIWMVDRTDLPRKLQNTVKSQITGRETSLYAATEVIPVFQHEAVETREPRLYSRLAHNKRPLATPGVTVSKPVAGNEPVYRSQESMFEMYDRVSRLLLPRAAASLPDRRTSDSTMLRDFLQIVGRRIEGSKRYPEWARDSGLEGKVVVRFTILQNGTLGEHIQLVKSSGFEILDNAAIAAIRDAAPFPALPDPLNRKQLRVELPMDFRLRES